MSPNETDDGGTSAPDPGDQTAPREPTLPRLTKGSAALDDPVFHPTEGGGFSQGMKAGAVVGTIFAPFVSVIVALVMLGSETNPVRRRFLKTWAAISGGLLALGLVIFLMVASSFGSSGPSDEGPCQGGPKMGSSAVHVGPHRWRVDCEFGGHDIIDLGP